MAPAAGALDSQDNTMPALDSPRPARKPNNSSIEVDSKARPMPSTSLAAGSIGNTEAKPAGRDAVAAKGLVSGTGAGWTGGFAAANTANGSSTGPGAANPLPGCPDCPD